MKNYEEREDWEQKLLDEFFNENTTSQSQIHNIGLAHKVIYHRLSFSNTVVGNTFGTCLLNTDFSKMKIKKISTLKTAWLLGLRGSKTDEDVKNFIINNHSVMTVKRVLMYSFINQDFRDVMFQQTKDPKFLNKAMNDILLF